MPTTEPSGGVMAASAQLRELLSIRPEYRHRWMEHAKRMRNTEVNYAGVSQVLALYLWDSGLIAETELDLPRKLRDRVRQAIRGELLTHQTLSWFIEAFEFDAEDTHKIWDAFAGRSTTNLEGNGIAFSLRTPPVPLVKPQQLRTTALFSRYYVGVDRMLERIETSHIVIALEDRVDTFAYSPRDSVIEAEAVAGGTFSGFRESVPGFVGLEFKLDQPLLQGQCASLQYFTTHRSTSNPCTELRRAARKRMDNLDMRVVFSGAYPTRAWWCVWDSYDEGEVVQATPVETTHRSELHQFVPYIEHSVVGFMWEW